ncbi:MAG: hypothetical protein ACO3IV_06580 [Ilumatobacteraceae bacterium]
MSPRVDEGDGEDEVGADDGAPTLVVESAVTTIPVNCPAPAELRSVFIGTVRRVDGNFAVYAIDSVRAGTVNDLLVNGEINVRYPADDVGFLKIGSTYLVGAVAAPSGILGDVPVLESKVRAEPEMFGGDNVAAAARVRCPSFEDPVRTLLVSGEPVDTSIIAPLRGSRRLLAAAVGAPIVLVLGTLVMLVSVKGVFSGVRAQRRRRRAVAARSRRD